MSSKTSYRSTCRCFIERVLLEKLVSYPWLAVERSADDDRLSPTRSGRHFYDGQPPGGPCPSVVPDRPPRLPPWARPIDGSGRGPTHVGRPRTGVPERETGCARRIAIRALRPPPPTGVRQRRQARTRHLPRVCLEHFAGGPAGPCAGRPLGRSRGGPTSVRPARKMITWQGRPRFDHFLITFAVSRRDAKPMPAP